MNWKNKHILVTGSGGFIASHLVGELVQRSAKVQAFIHYNSRADVGLLNHLNKDVLSEVEIIPGDLRDLIGIQQAMKGVDLVFHLGAIIAIPYS
ncbi:MAG: GDP-mannose 4,6-dehydratase, partial [Anaerolineaceae bacterium]